MRSFILALFALFIVSTASGSNCYNNVVQQAVVNYPQVNVAFVPSQISLGGQITIYDPNAAAATGLGYSYQGPVATMPSTVDSSITQLQIIDGKLDILIKALGASSETTPAAGSDDTVDPNPVQPNGSAHPEAAAVKVEAVEMASGECVKSVEEAFTEPAVEVAAARGWKNVLQDKCAKCHSSGTENGFELLNADGSFKDKLPRYEIYRRLTLDEKDPEFMPKGGKKLDESDLELIRAWVHKGLEGLAY